MATLTLTYNLRKNKEINKKPLIDEGNSYKCIDNLEFVGLIPTKYICNVACSCYINKDKKCGNNCINKINRVQCDVNNCSNYGKCENVPFKKNIEHLFYVKFIDEFKGNGVRSLNYIDKETFLFEYCGKVIDAKEKNKRIKKYENMNKKNYIVMKMFLLMLQ